MKTSLGYRKNFLCVVIESRARGGSLIRKWYPIREANLAEVRPLLGRELVAANSRQGVYTDQEGNVFQLASSAEAKPVEVECAAMQRAGDLAHLLKGSLRKVEPSRPAEDLGHMTGTNNKLPSGRKRKPISAVIESPANHAAPTCDGIGTTLFDEVGNTKNLELLNLRQKLAVVRRRLGYIQKRGHNELYHYTYVTAADLTGAVGDILAELGILVLPRLESISHESVRHHGSDGEHLTHVVMSYSFVDVDTAEDITVKVAGEGVDTGDKAPYKAMTGALKYALLQSFLLATGDDPEDERATQLNRSSPSARGSEQLITTEESLQLQQLIEDTNTELERVLAYYKLSSLEEMTESTYRRALDLLRQKKARQNPEASVHAQN